MSKIKLTGNSNLLKKTTSSINQRELSLAMAEATNCGSGLNPLKGYISLPSFNGETGEIDGFVGIYFVDGELVVDTLENVKNQIDVFCNGGGLPPIVT